MKIALDYDGTVTEDPKFWLGFVKDAVKRGHEVKIVTYRSKDEQTYDMVEFAGKANIGIFFTNHTSKHSYCLSVDWDPDVWIDDAPALIDHNDKPWSKEKLDEWAKTLSNRIVEEPESTRNRRVVEERLAKLGDF